LLKEISFFTLFSGKTKEKKMNNEKHKTEKELQEIILQEKARGTPDLEIGQKYGVTYRYIERLIVHR